jgi:hypothetical protein
MVIKERTIPLLKETKNSNVWKRRRNGRKKYFCINLGKLTFCLRRSFVWLHHLMAAAYPTNSTNSTNSSLGMEEIRVTHTVTYSHFFFVLSHPCTLSIRKKIRIVQFFESFAWLMDGRVSLRVTCDTLRVTCDTLLSMNHAKNSKNWTIRIFFRIDNVHECDRTKKSDYMWLCEWLVFLPSLIIFLFSF